MSSPAQTPSGHAPPLSSPGQPPSQQEQQQQSRPQPQAPIQQFRPAMAQSQQQQHMSPYAPSASSPLPPPPPQSHQPTPLPQSQSQPQVRPPTPSQQQPLQHTFLHHTPVTMSASAGGQPPVKRQKLSPLPTSRPHTPVQQQQQQPQQQQQQQSPIQRTPYGPSAFQTPATTVQTHAQYAPSPYGTMPASSGPATVTYTPATVPGTVASMAAPLPTPTSSLQAQQQMPRYQPSQQQQQSMHTMQSPVSYSASAPMSSMQSTFSMQPYPIHQPTTTMVTTTAVSATTVTASALPQTPAAPPPPGAMGPPSRPVEKATDAAELTDVLASSGIDVKEEEAYLTNAYPTTQPSATPQTARALPIVPPIHTPGAGLGAGVGPVAGTPGGYAMQTPVATPGGYFSAQTAQAGMTMSPQQAEAEPSPLQPPTEETLTDEKKRQDTQAARRAQYHLHNPFLQAQLIKDKIEARASELGVSWPSQGVYSASSTPGVGSKPPPIDVVGPDGSSVVKTGGTFMQYDAPLVDILSLISLACEERVRGLVERASALSRSRRANSHGLVAEPWKPLAKTPVPPTIPAKGKEYKEDPEPYRAITEKSRKIIDADMKLEKARAAKRAKRKEDAILNSIDGRKDGVGADVNAIGASPAAAERGEDTPREKKVTKKDLKKAENKVSEAVQHQQSIETARMATSSLTSGSSFFGKKKYNWLSNGAGGLGSTRTSFGSPAARSMASARDAAGGNAAGEKGAGKNAPVGKGAQKGDKGAKEESNEGKELGVFREDGERGLGIQTRDLLLVLETDGKGTRVLQKGYIRDSRDNFDRIQSKDKEAQ